VWPFDRKRGGRRGPPEPVPFTPRRTDWQLLPPIQRVVGDQWLVNPADSLSSHLASWHDPSYLAPLGHEVPPDGPSGAIEPAPVRAEPKRIDLQRSAAPGSVAFADAVAEGSDTAVPDAPQSEPSVRSVTTEPPRPQATAQRSADTEAPRPLLGETAAMASSVAHAAADEAPAPAASAGPPVPLVPAVPVRPPAQRVTTPFAVQRIATSASEPVVGASRVDPPVPVRPAAPQASLLAASDAPEQRSLPVVAAAAPAVQRAVPTDETPSASDTPVLRLAAPATGTAAETTSEPAAEPEIAPLIGEPGLGGPIEPIVQTTASEPAAPEAAADPPAPSGPPPTAPLIAHRPTLQRVDGPVRAPLGLGAPQSGPMAVPHPAVQRSTTGAPPGSGMVLPAAPPITSLQATAESVTPAPSRSVVQPAAPQVLVSRAVASSASPMPVAARAVEHPAPAYRPPEPTPTVPLLGERAFEPTPSAPAPATPLTTDAPAPQPAAADAPSVQRGTWSHMPQPAFQPPVPAAPLRTPPSTLPPLAVAAAPAAAPPQTLPQDLPVQRFGAQLDQSEPSAAAPEPVVQRVSVDRPEPHVVVQTEETPAAPAAPEPAPTAPAAADPSALLAVLYEPLMRRLRADLRVDRERRGRLTDL
jgi:hypothetical protein